MILLVQFLFDLVLVMVPPAIVAVISAVVLVVTVEKGVMVTVWVMLLGTFPAQF